MSTYAFLGFLHEIISIGVSAWIMMWLLSLIMAAIK